MIMTDRMNTISNKKNPGQTIRETTYLENSPVTELTSDVGRYLLWKSIR
jgi:hypothetical protein